MTGLANFNVSYISITFGLFFVAMTLCIVLEIRHRKIAQERRKFPPAISWRDDKKWLIEGGERIMESLSNEDLLETYGLALELNLE